MSDSTIRIEIHLPESVTVKTDEQAKEGSTEYSSYSTQLLTMNGWEYLRHPDGRMESADTQVQLNFTVSAKERHLLKQLAYDERRSLVSYLREILEARGLM